MIKIFNPIKNILTVTVIDFRDQLTLHNELIIEIVFVAFQISHYVLLMAPFSPD